MLVLKRYFWICVYGILSAVLYNFLLNSNFFEVYLNKWEKYSSNLPYYSKLVLIASFGGVLTYLVRSLGIYHPKQKIINHIKYPSIILSVIIGLVIINYKNYLYIYSFINENIITSFFALLSFCFGAFLFINSEKYPKHKRFTDKKKEKDSDTEIEKLTKENILKWIKSETPILTKNEDQFHRRIYSDRIFKRLFKSNEEDSKHIALIGPYGSGKTSICKLVEEKAKEEKRKWIFVYIDGWGRKSSSVAGQILELAVEKMSEFVDCIALKSLPANYLKALDSSKLKWGKVISAILGYKTDPEQNLMKLDSVLQAIDHKLILILEDFDRNSDSFTRDNQLPSLLDRLRKFENISFILSIGSEKKSTGTLQRICSYREDLIPIKSINIIRIFINKLKESAKREKIHIFSIKDYEEVSISNKSDKEIKTNRYYSKGIFEIVSNLLITPRDLKHVLRRTFEVWNKIKGEVILEDLLIINTIRHLTPDLLTILIDGFDYKKIEYQNYIPNDLRENNAFIMNLKCLVEHVFLNDSNHPQYTDRNKIYLMFYEDKTILESSDQRIIKLLKYLKDKDISKVTFNGLKIGEALNKLEYLHYELERFSGLIIKDNDVRIKVFKSLFEEALKHIDKSATTYFDPNKNKLMWLNTFSLILKEDCKVDPKFYLNHAIDALSYSMTFALNLLYKMVVYEKDRSDFINKFCLIVYNSDILYERIYTNYEETLKIYINLIEKYFPNKLTWFGSIIFNLLKQKPNELALSCRSIFKIHIDNYMLDDFLLYSLFGNNTEEFLKLASTRIEVDYADHYLSDNWKSVVKDWYITKICHILNFRLISLNSAQTSSLKNGANSGIN